MVTRAVKESIFGSGSDIYLETETAPEQCAQTAVWRNPEIALGSNIAMSNHTRSRKSPVQFVWFLTELLSERMQW